MPKRRTGLVMLTAAAVMGSGVGASAEDYPSRPIRFIVGYAAGGGNDLFARLVVQKFQEQTGHTAIVENKVGAGGRIAVEYVAKQAADGYTVLVGATGQMSIASAIYPDLPYHPPKTFIPLNMIAWVPLLVVVSANTQAKSVKELVAWATAHPDKANYGSSSPALYISAEQLKLKNGLPGGGAPVHR